MDWDGRLPISQDRTALIDLAAQLLRHEGQVKLNGRHVVYDDATGKPLKTGDVILGVPTIGHGRNLLIGLTDEEAAANLKNDILEKREQLLREFPWTAALPADAQTVLLNMSFQMGVGGLSTFKDFLGALQAGKYEDAFHAMLQSKWAVKHASRAKELAAIIRGLG